MQWLILIGVGLICSLIARFVLIASAFKVSWKWGIGVLFPFGPMLFRMNYPDDARRARPWQLAALPCFAIYIFLGPGLSLPPIPQFAQKEDSGDSVEAKGYAIEQPASTKKSSTTLVSLTNKSDANIEERRAANARELQRLAALEKELKHRKRDLLRSDVEGNAKYERDWEEYEVALMHANEEKEKLAAAKH